MPHSSRATGVALLILILSASQNLGTLFAQDAVAAGGSVNQQLVIDAAGFTPFELEYENEADDGRQVVTTVSYSIDETAHPEPLVTRRLSQEYVDWSSGFPKTTRHYVIESTARASDLRPIRTEVVNQYWSDAEAAWISERMLATFSPGHVLRRLEASDDTTVLELDLPDGILQSGMIALALGLHPEPPSELALVAYDWLAHDLERGVYDTVGRDTVAAAGRTFDAILVEGVNTETSEVIDRVYYRAEIPRFFVSTDDPDSPLAITRVREGP